MIQVPLVILQLLPLFFLSLLPAAVPPPPPFVRIYAGNGRQSYTGNYLYFIHVAFAILQKHINKKADIIAPAWTTNADKYAQTRRQM